MTLQSALALVVQNRQWQHLSNSAPADLELICTGTQMQWISLPQTLAQGSFVFVEAPEEIDPQKWQNLCPEQSQLELQPELTVNHNGTFESLLTRHVYAPSILTHHLVSRTYSKALSRAPPTLFS